MSATTDECPSIAILVGGASARMGRPKGTIASPDGPTLLERLIAIAEPIGDVMLVGDARPYSAIAPSVPRIADAATSAGPLGGRRLCATGRMR